MPPPSTNPEGPDVGRRPGVSRRSRLGHSMTAAHEVVEERQHGYPSVYFSTCRCGIVGTSYLSSVAARSDMDRRHVTDVIAGLTAGEVSVLPGRTTHSVSVQDRPGRVWADGGVS